MSDDFKFYIVKSKISRTKIQDRSYVQDKIEVLDEISIDADEYEDRFEPAIDLFYDLISDYGKFD